MSGVHADRQVRPRRPEPGDRCTAARPTKRQELRRSHTSALPAALFRDSPPCTYIRNGCLAHSSRRGRKLASRDTAARRNRRHGGAGTGGHSSRTTLGAFPTPCTVRSSPACCVGRREASPCCSERTEASQEVAPASRAEIRRESSSGAKPPQGAERATRRPLRSKDSLNKADSYSAPSIAGSDNADQFCIRCSRSIGSSGCGLRPRPATG